MNFRERYMNGQADFEELFTLTDAWNFSDDPRTLREYLGLTATEEDVWISESDEALEELLKREKRTKILFLDLDGTLLTDDKQLSEGNRTAIAKALAMGHKIVLNTGRPLASAKLMAKELSLNRKGCFLIAFNGGEIYDCGSGRSIYRKTLPLKHIRHIFDEAQKHGLHCQTYDEESILAEKPSAALEQYKKLTNIDYRIVESVTEDLQTEPVKAIVIDYHDHDALERFRRDLDAWATGKTDRFFSCPAYLEHVAPGVSKGEAMVILCDTLGIPLCNTIAAGDAENDISMLETAAVGVAMANASQEVKNHSDYITHRDNNHDGVAEIIEKWMI